MSESYIPAELRRHRMSYDVEQHGFAIVPRVLEDHEQRTLISILGPVSGAGRRGLLASPVVAEMARSPRLLDLIRPHLPSEPFPVRAIYFDKSGETNWFVPWHQDLTLALRARTEAPGFGPWSTKDGIPHVQPPVDLNMRPSLYPANSIGMKRLNENWPRFDSRCPHTR